MHPARYTAASQPVRRGEGARWGKSSEEEAPIQDRRAGSEHRVCCPDLAQWRLHLHRARTRVDVCDAAAFNDPPATLSELSDEGGEELKGMELPLIIESKGRGNSDWQRRSVDPACRYSRGMACVELSREALGALFGDRESV